MAAKKSSIDTKALVNPQHWIRLLLMIIYLFVNYFVRFAIIFIAIIQFFFVLLTNNSNEQLLVFSKSLARFSYQIMVFVLYVSEEKPFPFTPWPEA